jgi:hypothetical protein
MEINGKHYRTIWLKENDPTTVQIIDQRFLPHQFVIEELRTVDEFAAAIKEMHVRGAPLIGATASLGLYAACLEAPEGAPGLEHIQNALAYSAAPGPQPSTCSAGQRGYSKVWKKDEIKRSGRRWHSKPLWRSSRKVPSTAARSGCMGLT